MTLMDNLLNLFKVDAQVRGLRTRLEAAERYLKAQVAQLNALNERREEMENRKKHIHAATSNLEHETQSIDERIEKLRDELNSAVNNKQYAALLKELNTVKEGRGDTEDKILQEMESVEQIDAQLEELAQQIVEREKVRVIAEEQLAERSSEVGSRLSELETEREQAASCVPGTHLAVFEEMSRMCDGESMAQIDEIDRRHRDYACGACHMTVPFEHVAVLLGNAESLVQCTACSRILYIQEDTRGALAKK